MTPQNVLIFNGAARTKFFICSSLDNFQFKMTLICMRCRKIWEISFAKEVLETDGAATKFVQCAAFILNEVRDSALQGSQSFASPFTKKIINIC